MNKMDDCETSLQVLRGFDADITAEVNDIKACIFFHSSRLTNHNLCELHFGYYYVLNTGHMCTSFFWNQSTNF